MRSKHLTGRTWIEDKETSSLKFYLYEGEFFHFLILQILEKWTKKHAACTERLFSAFCFVAFSSFSSPLSAISLVPLRLTKKNTFFLSKFLRCLRKRVGWMFPDDLNNRCKEKHGKSSEFSYFFLAFQFPNVCLSVQECRTMKLRLFLSLLFFGNLYQGDAVGKLALSCFIFCRFSKTY